METEEKKEREEDHLLFFFLEDFFALLLFLAICIPPHLQKQKSFVPEINKSCI